MQKSIKNSKKFVYYNEELVHRFKISNAIISKTTTIQNMSYKMWAKYFSRDPHLLGQPFLLNGQRRTLVGIMFVAIKFW